MEKGKYTLSEILNQAKAWDRILSDFKRQERAIEDLFNRQRFDEVVFTGCGSSYYLALSAAATFQHFTGIDAIGVPASEVFLFPDAIFCKRGKYLLVPISRSGETSETVKAAKFFLENLKGDILPISCYEKSSLAALSDENLISFEGKEKSVVMTKSFTSMLLIVQLCAAIVAENQNFYQQLQLLPSLGEKIIKKNRASVEEIAQDEGLTKFIYLGSGPYYGLACEAALKVKEMAYATSEAYHWLEFRHGPLSIIDKDTLLIGLFSDSAAKYEGKLLQEAKSLGAKTLVIAERLEKDIDENADYLVILDSNLSDYARLLLYMPLVHLLAYYKAIAKGADPDSPKNLTQVVRL